MTTCPDLDGDMIEDLVVSQLSTDRGLVYSTKTGLFLRGVAEPFGVPGTFGIYMNNLGDLNGDDYKDYVISDVFASTEEEFSWSGAAFVFSGVSSELLCSYYGVRFSFFGLSATSLRDLNHDGRQEIAVGAPFGYGKVYIFSINVPGDANQDGRISLADVVVKINYIFRSGPRPLPMSVADDDCNGTIDLNDIICAVNYIFKGQTQGCCLK